MTLMRTTALVIGLAVATATNIVRSEELKRDATAQEAFDEGCDKNQSNMNICSYFDYRVQDAKLNALYKEQLSRLKGSGHEQRFKNAQRAWLKYVEADCLYQSGPREESGTIWPLENNSCRTAHFMQRIVLLQSFLECTQNGCPGQ